MRRTPSVSDIAVPIPESVPPRLGEPVRRAVMVQRWSDLGFVHWPYEPEVVGRLLPPEVEVDTFGGAAWIGLIPFHMDGLGFPWFSPLPHVGSFPEVNVRTYVRAGDRRGVWFFSLDVNKLLPTLVARALYRLPYCYGRVEHRRNGYLLRTRVERRFSGTERARASCRLELAVGEAVDPGNDLATFLTARWGLVTGRAGKLVWAPVEHPEWSLFHGDLLDLDSELVEAAGLPAPAADPTVYYSPGVDVRVGRPVRLVARGR